MLSLGKWLAPKKISKILLVASFVKASQALSGSVVA